jgi:hypothetical protein
MTCVQLWLPVTKSSQIRQVSSNLSVPCTHSGPSQIVAAGQCTLSIGWQYASWARKGPALLTVGPASHGRLLGNSLSLFTGELRRASLATLQSTESPKADCSRIL